jgi:diguanylate cyclase (GGDEF)-like protein
LVITSTDVILISRQGRIEYATPSAAVMFGREVIGEAFGELVRREPPGNQRAGDPNPPPGASRPWSADEEGAEGHIRRPDGSTATVLVHRRDLTDDPTVGGVVSTLRDVTAEWELRRSLAYRASHDALTGLANAEMLRDALRADREAEHRDAKLLSVVLFIDLDDFKAVNDTFGHEVGDSLLVTVARRIQTCLRSGDLAARLGGDEFAVFLRGVPGASAARAAAQRIADALSQPANVAGIVVDSQASIGLAIARTPAEFDSLLRRADTALYTAKAGGKGQWRQYQEGMISPVRRRTDLREELETAIREDKLTLHYQPIVELETGQARGFEALIRYDRGAGPPMLPEELITIAENNALIVPLGDWIMRRSLADVAQLNVAAAQDPRYVSVNVSVRQLRQPGFADTVRAHLADAGVSPSLLVIEITESLLLSDEERAWQYLAELRRDGVRVAIDDYGTGYASASYLRQSAIDIVKIDRRFLNDLTSQRSRILLEAVLQVAANLGLEQVAEGVEDTYARDVLRLLGCRYGQGFLYAHPMPLAQASSWLGG